MTNTTDILVIDDNDADIFFTRLIFQKMSPDIKVEACSNACKALSRWQAYCAEPDNAAYKFPPLVFLDIHMPVLNGFELLREIQATPDPHNLKAGVKFFMLSGSDKPEYENTVEESYRNLIAGFYAKPLTANAVDEVMKQHFSELCQIV